MMDMATRRLNLSIPDHFDDLLGEMSSLSGRSKASFVLDAMAAMAKHWAADRDHLRTVVARQATAPVHDDDQVVVVDDSKRPLSRQQRRYLERQQNKKGSTG